MTGLAVVDASVAVKWLLDEVHTEEAFALARSWARSGVQPVAPSLLLVEVANTLHRRVVRHDLSLTAALALLDDFLSSGLVEIRDEPGLHRRAVEMASEIGAGAVYDALYLALAEAVSAQLWTADQRLYRSARRSYPVRWIGEIDASGG